MHSALASSKASAGGLVIAPIVIAVVAGCTPLKTPTASAKVVHKTPFSFSVFPAVVGSKVLAGGLVIAPYRLCCRRRLHVPKDTDG